jgi:hypothetical protein
MTLPEETARGTRLVLGPPSPKVIILEVTNAGKGNGNGSVAVPRPLDSSLHKDRGPKKGGVASELSRLDVHRFSHIRIIFRTQSAHLPHL